MPRQLGRLFEWIVGYFNHRQVDKQMRIEPHTNADRERWCDEDWRLNREDRSLLIKDDTEPPQNTAPR